MSILPETVSKENFAGEFFNEKGSDPLEEEFFVGYKFYKISQIRVWQERGYGMSGFEVTFSA